LDVMALACLQEEAQVWDRWRRKSITARVSFIQQAVRMYTAAWRCYCGNPMGVKRDVLAVHWVRKQVSRDSRNKCCGTYMGL